MMSNSARWPLMIDRGLGLAAIIDWIFVCTHFIDLIHTANRAIKEMRKEERGEGDVVPEEQDGKKC